MQKYNPRELTKHPKNEFFFDDMDGQKWKEFLESVRTSGIIEPPVVTSEKVIVSGHQRIRACIELGIDEIYCEVRQYDDQDKVVKDLIETNIRQRGNINSSDLKTGRIIKELERIYGTRQGSAGKSDPQVADGKSQSDIAKELGMSTDKLNRLKKLTELPEEYQDMLIFEKISTHTANSIISKLSEEEQMDLLTKLPATQKLTQSQVQHYIDQIQALSTDNETLRQEAVDATRAVRAATDSKEYLRMKKAKEETDELYRKAFEDLQNMKKRDADRSSERLSQDGAKEKAVIEERERYNRVIEELNVELERAKDEQQKVIPKDYERIKEELSQTKARLQAIETSGDPNISKQILRVHTDERTPEQKVNDFDKRLLSVVGGFLSQLRGCEIDFELCTELPSVTKSLLRRHSEEIAHILEKMDCNIMEGTEKCRTA